MNRRFVLALFAAIASGCAATPSTQEALTDVARDVKERAGHDLTWAGSPEDERLVGSRVRELLSRELTPEAAVAIALLNSPSVTATLEGLGVQRARWAGAKLYANPTLDGDVKFFGGEGVLVEFALVQSLLDVVFVPLRSRVAEEEFLAEKATVASAVLGVVADVKLAVLSAQAATQTAELWEHVAEATSASADFAARLKNAGNITLLTQLMESATAAEARVQLAAARASVVQARERVNTLLGLYGSDTTWRLPGRMPDLPPASPSYGDVERRAVEASFPLRAQRHRVESAVVAAGFARPFTIWGEVHAGASAEREPDGAFGAGPAFSLPIPLFDAGGPESEAAGAEFRRRASEYAALAITTRSAARAAWARLEATRGRAKYLREVVLPLRRRIVEETQKHFNAMLVGAFELLVAKQQEVEAGARYVESLRDYWAARTELERLLAGAGTTTAPASAALTTTTRSQETH